MFIATCCNVWRGATYLLWNNTCNPLQPSPLSWCRRMLIILPRGMTSQCTSLDWWTPCTSVSKLIHQQWKTPSNLADVASIYFNLFAPYSRLHWSTWTCRPNHSFACVANQTTAQSCRFSTSGYIQRLNVAPDHICTRVIGKCISLMKTRACFLNYVTSFSSKPDRLLPRNRHAITWALSLCVSSAAGSSCTLEPR